MRKKDCVTEIKRRKRTEKDFVDIFVMQKRILAFKEKKTSKGKMAKKRKHKKHIRKYIREEKQRKEREREGKDDKQRRISEKNKMFSCFWFVLWLCCCQPSPKTCPKCLGNKVFSFSVVLDVFGWLSGGSVANPATTTTTQKDNTPPKIEKKNNHKPNSNSGRLMWGLFQAPYHPKPSKTQTKLKQKRQPTKHKQTNKQTHTPKKNKNYPREKDRIKTKKTKPNIKSDIKTNTR